MDVKYNPALIISQVDTSFEINNSQGRIQGNTVYVHFIKQLKLHCVTDVVFHK